MVEWDNPEDAFKELETKEFSFFAKALAAYKRALVQEGFNDEEAMRLVEAYSKFIYDMSVEEYLTDPGEENEDDDQIDPFT